MPNNGTFLYYELISVKSATSSLFGFMVGYHNVPLLGLDKETQRRTTVKIHICIYGESFDYSRDLNRPRRRALSRRYLGLFSVLTWAYIEGM